MSEQTEPPNGPACAYCGKRYDFANRPVGIENCCRACLPPQTRMVTLDIIPRIRRALPGRTKSRIEQDFEAAADRMREIIETPPAEIDGLADRLRAMSAPASRPPVDEEGPEQA